jgi:DNA-binding GntR family transcriptional regulator
MRAGGTSGPQRMGDTLYEALRVRILTGDLPPGARLSVPAIAREYHVSRSPVRDAVIRLLQEGLARETVNRGAEIAVLDSRELVSLYEARAALESTATRLAVQRSDAGLRRRLLTILTEHHQVATDGDYPRHVILDAAFHRELRMAADSPVIERMLDDIQDQVALAMRSTSLTGGMRSAVEDHQAIFEAVTAGDPEAAADTAWAHIHRLKELLRNRET